MRRCQLSSPTVFSNIIPDRVIEDFKTNYGLYLQGHIVVRNRCYFFLLFLAGIRAGDEGYGLHYTILMNNQGLFHLQLERLNLPKVQIPSEGYGFVYDKVFIRSINIMELVLG